MLEGNANKGLFLWHPLTNLAHREETWAFQNSAGHTEEHSGVCMYLSHYQNYKVCLHLASYVGRTDLPVCAYRAESCVI